MNAGMKTEISEVNGVLGRPLEYEECRRLPVGMATRPSHCSRHRKTSGWAAQTDKPLHLAEPVKLSMLRGFGCRWEAPELTRPRYFKTGWLQVRAELDQCSALVAGDEQVHLSPLQPHRTLHTECKAEDFGHLAGFSDFVSELLKLLSMLAAETAR